MRTISQVAELTGISIRTLQYFGLAICGLKKKVNMLTGSMPLLR